MHWNRLLLTTILAASAQAGTLLEVGPGGPAVFASAPIGLTAAYASGFTLDQTYTNVQIDAIIGTTGRSYPAGEAYLTTNIGPTATVADEIDSRSIAFPVIATLTSGSFVSIFSGLTLDAGTYYLVIKTPEGNSTDPIGMALGTAVTTAPGISFVGDYGRVPAAVYGPSSAFGEYTSSNYRIRVSGDPAVPEPATMALTGAALLAAGLLRRRS